MHISPLLVALDAHQLTADISPHENQGFRFALESAIDEIGLPPDPPPFPPPGALSVAPGAEAAPAWPIAEGEEPDPLPSEDQSEKRVERAGMPPPEALISSLATTESRLDPAPHLTRRETSMGIDGDSIARSASTRTEPCAETIVIDGDRSALPAPQAAVQIENEQVPRSDHLAPEDEHRSAFTNGGDIEIFDPLPTIPIDESALSSLLPIEQLESGLKKFEALVSLGEQIKPPINRTGELATQRAPVRNLLPIDSRIEATLNPVGVHLEKLIEVCDESIRARTGEISATPANVARDVQYDKSLDRKDESASALARTATELFPIEKQDDFDPATPLGDRNTPENLNLPLDGGFASDPPSVFDGARVPEQNERSAGGATSSYFAIEKDPTTASRTAIAAAPLRLETVAERLASKIELLAETRIPSRIRVRLEPEELGTITVVVKAFGPRFDADIIAGHEGVLHALEQGRASLAQAVESRGLLLGQLTITSGDASASDRQGQTANDHQLARHDFERAIATRNATQPEASASPRPIPVFASSHGRVDFTI